MVGWTKIWCCNSFNNKIMKSHANIWSFDWNIASNVETKFHQFMVAATAAGKLCSTYHKMFYNVEHSMHRNKYPLLDANKLKWPWDLCRVLANSDLTQREFISLHRISKFTSAWIENNSGNAYFSIWIFSSDNFCHDDVIAMFHHN